MDVRFDPGEPRLELDFPDLGKLCSFVADARDRKHFYLSLDVPAKPHSEVVVDLGAAGRRLSFRALVVQVFRSGTAGHGTAFKVLELADLEMVNLTNEESVEGDQAKPQSPAKDKPDLGETLGESPIFRIQQLNTSQKIRLATRAGRTERQILLRDTSPQVHMGLLSNPHVEDSEVLDLVRSNRTAGGTLQRIAKDPKWAINYEIRLALVKHPQTPTPVAVGLLSRLNKRDLGTLGKSSTLRESVKGPALRLYLKKM